MQACRRATLARAVLPRLSFIESLEERIALTVNYAIKPGTTLDIFPISSILPAGTDRMTVNFNSTPGVAHGTIYRVSGVDAYPWGSGAPNAFQPGYPNNRVFGGEGFRYTNNGTGDGTSESIPVTFRDSTGFTSFADTIVISINSNLQPPTITTQPGPFIQIPPNGTATMSVVATGVGTLTYQWYKGIAPDASNPIAGAKSASYTTPALGQIQQYMYWVKVSNSGGSVVSQTVTVQTATPTTVTTSDVSTPYKTTNRTVTLNATETPPQNVGDVIYTSLPLGGSTATSGTVVNGVAPPTQFTVPGGTAVGSYTFEAHYVAPAGIADSYDTKTITVTKASTTTTAANKTATASSSSQTVALSASVTSAAGTVVEGTVTFTLLDANANPIGSPVTSGTVSNGSAGANYTLPANVRAGTYAVKAVYNPGPNYNGSQDTAHTLTELPSVTNGAATIIAATATSFTIAGAGFDGATVANNTVVLPAGVTGSVTAATPTQLTVSNVTGLVGGPLNVQVTVGGQTSALAPAASVKAVITQSTIVIKPNVMTLGIDGFGFSSTAANNIVTMTPAVTGFVSTATRTHMTYVFTQQPQNGALGASVSIGNVSSGAAVQVASVDGIGPTAANGQINLNGASLGKVSIDLSDDFALNLLQSHFSVVTVGNNPVTINPTGVAQDAVTHTATFSFAAPFSKGNYKGTLTASGLTDGVGNPMAADYKFNFFFLPGDADGDRTVGPSDFNLLATNFGKTGQTWSKGDFDGDGVVGPADFNLQATNFGTTLPVPPAPILSAVAAAPVSIKTSSTAVSPVPPVPPTTTHVLPRLKAKHAAASQLLKGDRE